jgi:putative methanogenesis marker protein 8
MNAFGMCRPDRQITEVDKFVGFGATEMLGAALSVRIIDAAIVAGDGAGTVVVSDPAMLQGIGGRMSGLVSTSPIQEIIDRIMDEGGIVIDPENATLDPVSGIVIAHQAGFKSLAITVAGADAAEKVRQADPEAIIVVVHTTGISKEEAERLNLVADLITGCASLMVREVCGPKALMQAGSSIPVFAMTHIGKEIIIERMRQIPYQLIVSHAKLPVRSEDEPTPLQ